jgi:small conductance mechanosensitive channel
MPFAAAGSNSNSTDRGVIHQFLVDLGVGSSTAHTWQVYLIGPLRIILVLVIAFVLTRLVGGLSRRMVDSLRLVSPLVRATQRGQDRARTLAGVFASAFRVVIWVVALLTILGLLDINLIPFVATATVIGAALGFGAQTLVRDFLSGILILAEDQYGVGDSIQVGSGPNATTGMVEGVTLRTTRLRGADGVVWYVPNGEIRTLGNDTTNDSQALVDIIVPHGTDLVSAGAVAESAAREVAGEPGWEGVFVGSPTFAGVPDTNLDGATLRVTVWTKPGQHVRAARQLRLRVLERLRQAGAWEDGASPAPSASAADAGPATAPPPPPPES